MRCWLKAKREEKIFPQEYVAAKSGITPQYYSYIETGGRRPSVSVAKRIAALLGFDWTRFYEDGQPEC